MVSSPPPRAAKLSDTLVPWLITDTYMFGTVGNYGTGTDMLGKVVNHGTDTLGTFTGTVIRTFFLTLDYRYRYINWYSV